MNQSSRNPGPRSVSLEHILADYPLSTEDTVSKRYIFYHDLGSGAYANVKRGCCVRTNRSYAIKIISKSKTPKEYLRKFVPREVDALKKLSVFNHPFIAQMREFYETPQRIYLITKLAKGGDLLAYINARKHLNEDTTRRMASQILCALDHIHDQDIVHRDLKCENLLIGENDNILISDFGFATQQPRNKLLTSFCGSYAYAAPEILTGSSYNGKSTDVWSVGVILYAMLNGRLPFNDTKPKKILIKIKTTPLVMIRHVSMACEMFIRSVLTINAMERPNVSALLMNSWLESPLRSVIKMIPEGIQPACFKLSIGIGYKSSFKMSDSSEECLKIFSSTESGSPRVPVGITNDFILKNQSLHTNNTSSTISDRMKRKYRQIKSELKTWASKKRKAVIPLRDIEKYTKYRQHQTSPPPEPEKQHSSYQKFVKYAVHDNPRNSQKIFDIATTTIDMNSRAVSAVPPKNQRRLDEYKSRRFPRPESSGGVLISKEDPKYRSESKSSEFDSKQRRKNSNPVTERRVDKRILDTLHQKRDEPSSDTPTRRSNEQQFSVCVIPSPTKSSKTPGSGLPPLRRGSGASDVVKRKDKMRQQLHEHKETERKRRSTYDKAIMYHNIQYVSKNSFHREAQLMALLNKTDAPHKRISPEDSSRGNVVINFKCMEVGPNNLRPKHKKHGDKTARLGIQTVGKGRAEQYNQMSTVN